MVPAQEKFHNGTKTPVSKFRLTNAKRTIPRASRGQITGIALGSLLLMLALCVGVYE